MSSALREPLSWLTLERYALGELEPEERLRVEQRLATSPEDRACLESILADTALPPLPASLAVRRRKKFGGWLPISSGLVAAAAVLMLLFVGRDEQSRLSVLHNGTKGGEVALSLVGEQHGENPTHFSQGERFKLFVTCPSWFRGELRVVVFQAGARYEPLPSTALSCGNSVAWPGAIALDGLSGIDVCVAWGSEAVHAKSPHALGEDAACVRLSPQ